MSRIPVCEFPARLGEMPEDPVFQLMANASQVEAVNEVRPLHMEIEVTTKCEGSCKFCYARSTTERTEEIPLDGAKRMLEEAHELGVNSLGWLGGDAQLYPHLRELMTLATDLGMSMTLPTSGLLSKHHIELIMDFKDNLIVGIHLDTIDADTYAQVHFNPRTLQGRMNGYKRLLDSGYPPYQVFGLITVTDPVLARIEETIDWFCDMGAIFVCLLAFKGAQVEPSYEPSLSGFERACRYRAKKFGEHWLRFGSSEGSMYYCRTNISVDKDGYAYPCLGLTDYYQTENVFEHGLKEVFEKHRDQLLFNFRPKGICGDCVNNDLCFGCRANAYHYTGDAMASDPKCWLNPEAKEYIIKK